MPTGPDADSWYRSVLALTHDVPYPPNRWPLYAWISTALDLLTPGPAFVAAQATSLLATAAALTALFRLSSLLVGGPAAVTVVLAALAFPQVPNAAGWSNGYALWASGGLIATAGLAEGLRGRTAGFLAVGVGVTLVLATMEKGLPLGIVLGGLAGLAWALRGDAGRGLRLGVLVAPAGLLALLYAAFPIDLMTLDAQVTSPYLAEGVAEAGADGLPAPPEPPPPPPRGGPREDLPVASSPRWTTPTSPATATSSGSRCRRGPSGPPSPASVRTDRGSPSPSSRTAGSGSTGCGRPWARPS